jgi:hypothetical protein
VIFYPFQVKRRKRLIPKSDSARRTRLARLFGDAGDWTGEAFDPSRERFIPTRELKDLIEFFKQVTQFRN